jgi:hypothetical protein
MRTRDFIILLICAVTAAASLFAAGAQLDRINAQRETLKLVSNPALENAPPSLAFATVALGAFRGLIVDILWMRADDLKDKGQFFDARQVAEWITTLQPRFAAVWEFHAWNMAYNISVAIPASQPEQRWRWVKNGYELLRDKGIPLNPRSIQLYRELGRIFQHKMGGVSDDAHEYYKLQFAEEIGPLLESADNGMDRNDNRFLEALISMPAEWSAMNGDPNVAPFLQALRTADEKFADESAFVKNYLSLRQNPQRFKPAAAEVIEAYRGMPALKKFDLFAKGYQLRNEWKMDPAMMVRIGQKYGPVDFVDPNKHFPMDWRHPDSHAIYWAVKALDVAVLQKDRELTSNEVNTDRMVLHSLQNLFRYGQIQIIQAPADPNTGVPGDKSIFLGPDLRIFDSYNKAALGVLVKYGEDRGRSEAYDNGYRNMLKNAVLSFYQGGLRDQAMKVFTDLRTRFGASYPEFNVSLDQFAMQRLVEELGSLGFTDATEQVVTVLTNAYRLYAYRNDDAAAANERMAQQVWDRYYAEFGDTTRIDLPSMSVLRWVAINQFLNSDAYPVFIRRSLLERIRIEKPDLLKQLEQTETQLRQQFEQSQKTQTQ